MDMTGDLEEDFNIAPKKGMVQSWPQVDADILSFNELYNNRKHPSYSNDDLCMTWSTLKMMKANTCSQV